MCTTCALIPETGIKTHKSHINNKVHKITSHVTCVTENVVYKITCKKPQCKDFVYIGETKRKFAERFGEHWGYMLRKELDQVCGEHFNKSSHKYEDMLPVIIEEIFPKNDSFLRLKREKYWINQYEAKDYGANRKSWPLYLSSCVFFTGVIFFVTTKVVEKCTYLRKTHFNSSWKK